MKEYIFSFFLYIVRFGMCFIYFFIKLFPMKNNKITFLSRQSDKVNIDFELLEEQFKKECDNIEIQVLCKKIPKGLIKKIAYCFYMIKCLYHISTSKICIIDGYSIPISALKHKKNLIIIQIWHAMGAIKKFGKQVLDKGEGSKSSIAKIMKMHENYTYITCTSEKTKKFYAEGFGTEKGKILKLGMPRIDYLLGKDEKIDKKVTELLNEYPKLKEKKTILYVPTFRKGKSVHISDVINAVPNEKYNLIVRLHPLDKNEISNEYIIDSKYETFELLKIADYVITDYSAVAFEASVLDKPVFFYLYDIDEYNINRGLNINLLEEMPMCTFSDIKKIIEVIENDKYDYQELKKFKNEYVETSDMCNTERIVSYIKNLMEEKKL